jgi:hypothetical protein
MTHHRRIRILLPALLASGLTACTAPTGSGAGVQKPIGGKADNTAENRLCEQLDAPADCDPCAEAAWYGDGECDTFCAEPDPDCEQSECPQHIAEYVRAHCEPGRGYRECYARGRSDVSEAMCHEGGSTHRACDGPEAFTDWYEEYQRVCLNVVRDDEDPTDPVDPEEPEEPTTCPDELQQELDDCTFAHAHGHEEVRPAFRGCFEDQTLRTSLFDQICEGNPNPRRECENIEFFTSWFELHHDVCAEAVLEPTARQLRSEFAEMCLRTSDGPQLRCESNTVELWGTAATAESVDEDQLPEGVNDQLEQRVDDYAAAQDAEAEQDWRRESWGWSGDADYYRLVSGEQTIGWLGSAEVTATPDGRQGTLRDGLWYVFDAEGQLEHEETPQ